ncbi:MAG: hypothetical protein IKZ95_07080 [Lachnospiraceae bacterium]|nr:hypothetical protein [Lachnospiraceae bacterium]
MDPHIRQYREMDQQGDNGYGTDMGSDLKAARLYDLLEQRGEFAELDKAKRNEHYREYLLENIDQLEDGFYNS